MSICSYNIVNMGTAVGFFFQCLLIISSWCRKYSLHHWMCIHFWFKLVPNKYTIYSYLNNIASLFYITFQPFKTMKLYICGLFFLSLTVHPQWELRGLGAKCHTAREVINCWRTLISNLCPSVIISPHSTHITVQHLSHSLERASVSPTYKIYLIRVYFC